MRKMQLLKYFLFIFQNEIQIILIKFYSELLRYIDEGGFISDRDTFVFLKQSLVVSCSMQMLLRREKMSPFQSDAHKHKRSCRARTISIMKERIDIGDLDNGHEITKREAERTVFAVKKVICSGNFTCLSKTGLLRLEMLTNTINLILVYFLRRLNTTPLCSLYLCFSSFFLLLSSNRTALNKRRGLVGSVTKHFEGYRSRGRKKGSGGKSARIAFGSLQLYTNAKTGFRKWNSVRVPKNALAAITTGF